MNSFFITEENYFDYQPGLECAAYASAYVLRHFEEEADVKFNRKTQISEFERLWSNLDGIWDQPYFVIKKETD